MGARRGERFLPQLELVRFRRNRQIAVSFAIALRSEPNQIPGQPNGDVRSAPVDFVQSKDAAEPNLASANEPNVSDDVIMQRCVVRSP
jgi:hypothetical protein